MFKIYPKINCKFEGARKLERAIRDYGGIEMQFFDEVGIMNYFSFKDQIIQLKSRYDFLEEVTIHPPLNNYNIEMIILKDRNIIEKELKDAVELSKMLDISINIIYHSSICFEDMKEVLDKHMKELLEIIKGTNVTILLENIYMVEENSMSVLEYAAHINNPNLKVCFDLCHAYCKAHIYKADNIEFFDKYLDKEKCMKYVKQVHFSYTRSNDGYINKMTHGRRHDNYDSIRYDLEILQRYGMLDSHIVIEVDEDDHNYEERRDQISDLKMIYRFIGKEY